MKQIAPETQFYTSEEYLALEREAEFKHEYIHGEIVAMAGATREHILICGNVGRRLGNQLERSPCETYLNEMRVRTSPSLYVYPDVIVVCDEPHFEDEELDTLLNPTVVVEVLSRTTEARDRGEKFSDYRAIESVKDIIFISQYGMRVEHYERHNSEWVLHDMRNPADVVKIASIDCELTLSQIYERVKFTPPRQLRSVERKAE
jgi:Uma2 family endonuclease